MQTSSKSARHLVALSVLAVALLAVACGSSSSSSGGDGGSPNTLPSSVTVAPPAEIKTGGNLSFGLSAETQTGWLPTTSQWFNPGTIVSNAVFDRVAQYNDDRVAVPYLAESFTPNAGFTQWTIKLRPGIVFHNGEKLDASALKLNIDKEKASVLAGPALGVIESTTVVDDLTVQVNMSKPWATFPGGMTSQAGAVAAPAQLNSGDVQHPIGTGPFEFESWTPDSNLVVKKNPNYWQKDQQGRTLPYLDGVEFKILADASSRGAALESGSVDAIETADPPQMKKFAEAAANGRYQMYTNAANEASVQYIGLNTAKPPFDDPLARQIVAYGFDREFISDALYLGLFPPAKGLFPSGSPYFYEEGYPSYDLAKAQELEKQYEEKYGHPLSFTVNLPSDPYYRQVGEANKERAREFNVDINLNLVEVSQLITDALFGNYEATGFQTFGDPNIDRIFIASETVQPMGQLSLNFTRLDDPQLTADLDAARATDDVTVQAEQWKKAQQRLAQNLNLIFVVRGRSAVIYSNNVFGLLSPPLPNGDPSEISAAPLLTYANKS